MRYVLLYLRQVVLRNTIMKREKNFQKTENTIRLLSITRKLLKRDMHWLNFTLDFVITTVMA